MWINEAKTHAIEIDHSRKIAAKVDVVRSLLKIAHDDDFIKSLPPVTEKTIPLWGKRIIHNTKAVTIVSLLLWDYDQWGDEKYWTYQAIGFSFCGSKDSFCKKKGVDIAFARALRKMEDVEEDCKIYRNLYLTNTGRTSYAYY